MSFFGVSTIRTFLIAPSFVLCTVLSGCGGSPTPTEKTSFADAQKNLPDHGYWLCRLKYNDESGNTDTIVSFEETRTSARTLVALQCQNTESKNNCAKSISESKTECVRAQNIGGVSSRKRKTFCAVEFKVTASGTMETLTSSESTHMDATLSLIRACLKSDHKIDCTAAIIDGDTKCTYY